MKKPKLRIKDKTLPVFFAILIACMAGVYFWLAGNAEHTISMRRLEVPRKVVDLQKQQQAAQASPAYEEDYLNPAALTPETGDGTHSEIPELASKRIALKPAPDSRLQESGRLGPLPKIGSKGRTPWEEYSQPFREDARDKAKLAIVFYDAGLDDNLLSSMLNRLPPVVALSFSPYSEQLNTQIKRTRHEGFEVLLNIPMHPENITENDTGPYTLQTNLAMSENMERLEKVMVRATGYIGLLNAKGNKYVRFESLLKPVMEELTDRGLLFIDNGENLNSLAPVLSRKHRYLSLSSSYVLDNPPLQEHILEQLSRAVERAKETGRLIVLAQSFPFTIDTIDQWLEEFDDPDVAIVPLSTIARERFVKAYARSS